mgnify:FL=1
MAPQGYMPELFGNSKGERNGIQNIHIQYKYFMPIFLRFKEKLKQKLIKKNIQGNLLYEYQASAKEFTETFKMFVTNDDLSTYINANKQMPGMPLAFTEKITELKDNISKKEYFIRENVLRYWFDYHHKINQDPLIYLDKFKNFLKNYFVDYCNIKEPKPYNYIEIYNYWTFENNDMILKKPTILYNNDITLKYDLLIDILNDLYCVIICYYIDNEKKINELIISANKLFYRLYSIKIKEKLFCKDIGMINKFRNFGNKFFQRTNGGKKINNVTKPKVKKVTKPKINKVTKPNLKKSTKSKVKKVTKSNLKKSTKSKVKKVTKQKIKKVKKITKPKVKKVK